MQILSSKDLLKQQLAEASNPTPKRVKGVDISKSAGVEYNAWLQSLVRMIRSDVQKELMPTVRKLAPEYVADSMPTMDNYLISITAILERLQEKWSSPAFKVAASQQATKIIGKINTVNRRRFNKQVKTFGIDVFGDSPELDEALQAAVYDNTRLIESIPSQYLKNVESIVLTNIRAGQRPAAMEKLLQKQFGVTERRAKLIARDQTSKANGDINKKRQTASGFEYFEWMDSDDSRVRDRHEEIANKVTAYGKGVYRWDNPPLSDEGVPIIPGQDYNCRCVPIPVSNAQVKTNQKNGDTKPGVYR